ncbi:hypothetical protein [Campylobacter sp.]|uniref:hypothetical protein n=1 Tax=Campylobacter sp. TaxID=205 RepID=UPI0025B88BFC|nr:hypothetical protein [Campylobacter sp.]
MNLDTINAPFASQGDVEDFPYEADAKARLSWLTGFTYRYEDEPENDGLFVERLPFNKIINIITSILLDLKARMPSIESVNAKLDKAIYDSEKVNFVTTNTNQAINSIKTFNQTPKCINNPVDANDLVRLAYLNSVGGVGLGFLQNYQVLTNQRQANVVYTNTTNKPILVIITAGDRNGNWPFEIYINGIIALRYEDFGYKYERGNFTFIVPSGFTYEVRTENYLYYWSELR